MYITYLVPSLFDRVRMKRGGPSSHTLDDCRASPTNSSHGGIIRKNFLDENWLMLELVANFFRQLVNSNNSLTFLWRFATLVG